MYTTYVLVLFLCKYNDTDHYGQSYTLSLLLIVSTKFIDFKCLDLACINFSEFLSHAKYA